MQGQIPNLDFSNNSYDNENNNENDAIVINKKDFKTITDPGCEHFFRKDEDDLDGYTAWVCISCGRGALLPDDVTII